MCLERLEILLDRRVDAEIDHLETGTFQHHRHQVLADVVDVALHGADDDLADACRTGLGKERSKQLHPSLHGVGSQQNFGNEEDSVAEIDADDAHPLNQRLFQHRLGIPAATQQDLRAFDDLLGETVVEVVVHLLDELVVVEGREVDVVFAHGVLLERDRSAVSVRPRDVFRMVELSRMTEHYRLDRTVSIGCGRKLSGGGRRSSRKVSGRFSPGSVGRGVTCVPPFGNVPHRGQRGSNRGPTGPAEGRPAAHKQEHQR